MIIYMFIFGILIVDVCPFLIMRAVSITCNFSKLLATELYFGLQKLPILSPISCMTCYSLITRSSFIFAGGCVPGLLASDASSSVTQNRAAGEPAVKWWRVSACSLAVSLHRLAGAGILLLFMYTLHYQGTSNESCTEHLLSLMVMCAQAWSFRRGHTIVHIIYAQIM